MFGAVAGEDGFIQARNSDGLGVDTIASEAMFFIEKA